MDKKYTSVRQSFWYMKMWIQVKKCMRKPISEKFAQKWPEIIDRNFMISAHMPIISKKT